MAESSYTNQIYSTLVVDTNMMLLLMCASLKRDPTVDKRLSKYNHSDVQIIEDLISQFNKLLTTPNILTEVSNLSSGYTERIWLKDYINNVIEVFIPSKILSNEALFVQFGLTDICLTDDVSFDNAKILTDDHELANFLLSTNKQVIYYSDYRNERLCVG